MMFLRPLIAFALGMLAALPCLATVAHLLPPVKSMVGMDSAGFPLSRAIAVDDPTNNYLLGEFAKTVGGNEGDASITVVLVDSIPGAHRHNVAGYPDESYSISITPNNIRIKAVTETGVTRAAQTLGQLAIEGDTLPACVITDWPAFKVRGYMHDVGRSFISLAELKKQIRLLSAFKVNTFHWHLTENQAWRFVSVSHPELTSPESMTRFPGKSYTAAECRELAAEAARYGVIVIPEIDMPGHSEAFVRAAGCDMQSAEGKRILQQVLEEVAEAFPDSPYIHIGADEKKITDPTFLDMMIEKVHSLGRRVICWNPIKGVDPAAHDFDMTQMWSTAGTKIDGIPNIDCRYNYINHFDVFADLAGIYRSSIYYEKEGTDEVAGTITCVWNDRRLPEESDIISQNNFYANVLASAERGWKGGGDGYIEQSGAGIPFPLEESAEFIDFERRFLLHKDLSLGAEPIPYVRQGNVEWDVAVGDEHSQARGAGVYLRHPWGKNVPGLLGKMPEGTVAYARTYVYSPQSQTVGAVVELHNYSRSEKDLAPEPGQWDRKGSRIWINGIELVAPEWENSGKPVDNETDLLNENFAGRKPLPVTLREGWNEVMLELPHVRPDGLRLDKWMWTFVLTDLEGRNAAEGITYSSQRHE